MKSTFLRSALAALACVDALALATPSMAAVPTVTSPLEGSATLTDAQAADMMAGKWSVNVHTAANKGGEIGQLTK